MSKLLIFDANLSFRLVKKLNFLYPNCKHITDLGLKKDSKDWVIWDLAKELNRTIITNDEDYYHLSNIKGFPPKVILLRHGNQSTEFVVKILVEQYNAISDFIESEKDAIIEIY